MLILRGRTISCMKGLLEDFSQANIATLNVIYVLLFLFAASMISQVITIWMAANLLNGTNDVSQNLNKMPTNV